MKTDFYKELAEYTGREEKLVEARCNTASIELAWIFPKYKDNVMDFYRETDLYIFGLSRYQKQLQEKNFHEWLSQFIRNYNIRSVLDYGGGIGEYTIVACNAGAETVYQDIMGSETANYALYRFDKHGIKQPELWNENYVIDRDFDLIIAMDIFEHLEDPQFMIEKMSKHCTYLICNPELILYNEFYPEHISHFDLNPYFYKVHGCLWKNRNVQ
jgi:hypothetical protein